MSNESFEVLDITGSRLKGTFVNFFGIPLKHHGIIIGKSSIDGNIYVAENRKESGLALDTIENFKKRYIKHGHLTLEENNGNKTNKEVAQNALTEVSKSTGNKYNFFFNNCESFSNKAMYGHGVSGQVVLGLVACVGFVLIMKEAIKEMGTSKKLA